MQFTQILSCPPVNNALPQFRIIGNSLFEYFQHLPAVMHLIQAQHVVHVEKHNWTHVMPRS
ncbi:hypothetical protein CSQ96_27585 [Janthinobacterium sp. BJB412]|nr:hypothetical protein CSQ96_27585 [Janthinobacterium sp. BJB412]